jgi:hypothetical protein
MTESWFTKSPYILSWNIHLFEVGGFTICGTGNYMGVCQIIFHLAFYLPSFHIIMCNICHSRDEEYVLWLFLIRLSSLSFSLNYKRVCCFGMLFLFFLCSWGTYDISRDDVWESCNININMYIYIYIYIYKVKKSKALPVTGRGGL